MSIVVFDLEIQNSIDMKTVKWTDFNKMHVSVGCAFDYETGDYRTFLEDNMQGLVDLLESADLVAAFNNRGFDNPLIAAEAERLGLAVPARAGDGTIHPGTEHDYAAFLTRLNDKSFDMLEESRLGSGWIRGTRYPSGFKLDDHLIAIWGQEMAKTEDGAQAPILWRAGKHGQVIDYCLADVRRERLLFEWMWYGGLVKCGGSQGHKVRRPWEMLGHEYVNTRLPYYGGPFTDKAINTLMGSFLDKPQVTA